MTVSFIGAQGNAGTTVTIPAHQVGDLILIFAYRDASNTAPTTPAAGGTVPTWVLIGSDGANTNSTNFRYAVATATNTTSGTWTNATELLCLVYRGASIGAAAGTGANNTTTINYPALTLNRTNNTSWVVGVAGHKTATNVDLAPGAMVNRVSTGTEAAGHDTNATVTTWASTNVTVNASSAYRSWVVELRDKSLVDNATVGTFTLTGNAADLRHNPKIDGGTGAFTLTGNAADLRHNTRIDGGTGAFSLTGNDATLTEAGTAKSITAVVGTFSLTGNDATLKKGYSLAADAGTFTVAGQPATLRHNPRIEANTGSFALTGGEPALLHGRYLSGGAGTFIETGQPATFRRTWAIGANTGTFNLTGNPASLTEINAYEINPVVGTFVATGQPAQLAQSQSLPVEAGTFQLTGNPATLTEQAGAQFVADTGVFALAGQSVTLNINRVATAQVGTFSLSGQDAAFKVGRALLADAGVFNLTGNSITLTEAGDFELNANTGAFILSGLPAALVKTSRRRNVLIF